LQEEVDICWKSVKLKRRGREGEGGKATARFPLLKAITMSEENGF
jgi:hypothetical protein